MKLRLGKVLIETDHIEQTEIHVYEGREWITIKFVSGEKLQVSCKGDKRTPATWDMSAELLLQKIEGYDHLELREP